MPSDIVSLAGSLAFVDEIYSQFQRDPGAVDPSWRRLFENGVSQPWSAPAAASTEPPPLAASDQLWLSKVWAVVNAYRFRGHLEADLDPLKLLKITRHPELELGQYGFTEADLDRTVPAGIFNGAGNVPLREILLRARKTYCGSIGVEFMHISSPLKKQWLHKRMELTQNQAKLDRTTKIEILKRIAEAEALERFVHQKYVGTKRFSLEGGETLIPLLELVLEHAGELGVEEVVMGMAHRGRLNVLINTIGKKARDVFAEFEDIDPASTLGSGDVKYHLGYSVDHETRGGKTLHLSLAFNPSHLEAVDPVVVGRVRAKQRRRRDTEHATVLGVLIHGDAAFAGQGLVAETLNLSEIHGYRTGGTFHVIVNNQIGFTANPNEARSTPYATDVAKMLECPIFHVNGDDPEAVAHVVELASAYRREFRCDVVVDMFCYRKYGHNESDEPAFTQPIMYAAIEKKESVLKIYSDKLVADGVLSQRDVDTILAEIHADLEAELQAGKKAAKRPMPTAFAGVWAGYHGGPDSSVPEVDTGVDRARLLAVAETCTSVRPGFTIHPKIAQLFKRRLAMGKGELPLDWAMGELMAFGTLVQEKTLVRLSGQDSCRGTFSQRHAVVVDPTTGEELIPLKQLAAGEDYVRIYDSALSEAAVLGFEFGYSLDYPDGLIMWEAQFGDFVNGAQVIIDQFIASSEDKWKRTSGLVLLLPHGYEGQGPEHSSARPERFLELCAEDNMQVVYPTTPAQYFHVLRRQVVRKWRKPLIVLTPKSLLRHPEATSPLEALTHGRFQRVIPDPIAPAAVRRVLLCSGKVYYDLVEERKKRDEKTVAIVRIEQLYPWRDDDVQKALHAYPKLEELVWVQEEPSNGGALSFIERRLRRIAGSHNLRLVSRAESASPATGSHKAHVMEQRALVEQAFQ